MAAEQTKLDKAKQDEDTIQWKQEAYQDIIKDMKDLQSSFFDSMNSSKNILSASNFSPFAVSGVNGSTLDTSVATFTPGVGATTGTYSIHVTDLAAAATVTGDKIIKSTSGVISTSTVGTNWNGKTIKLKVDGGAEQTITLGSSDLTNGTSTATDLADKINAQITGNANLTGKVTAVVTTEGKIQFKPAGTATSVNITSTTVTNDMDTNQSTTMADLGLTADSKISFKYNGSATATEITVKTTDKISDVINNIVSKTSGAITATYSELTGSFSIKTANTGSAQSIEITDATATSAEKVLGLAVGAGTPGKDANVTITPPGGVATTITKSTNNFTVDGMTYNLSAKSADPANLNDVAKVSVSKDVQTVYDKISGFIDKYNTLVDKIQGKLDEKKSSDYKPLTDAQKETMSASQITAWETKAKVGILRNDNNLRQMLSDMRSAFTAAVSNSGLALGKYGSNAIGVETSDDYSKPGHIDISDPSKLKTAIADHGDQILKMFTNQSDAELPTGKSYDATTTKYQEDGIFTRIKKIAELNVGLTGTTYNTSILTSYANKQYDFSTTGTAGKGTLADQIYEKELMVKKIKDSMSDKQEAYYKKFSQLETAMNTLNAQQSQLSSLTSQ